MYTDNIDSDGHVVPNTIKRISDGVVITFDITNENYQGYLRWYSEQNPINDWTFPPRVDPIIDQGGANVVNQ